MKLKKFILLFFIYFITVIFTLYFCTIYRNSSKNVYVSSISDVITVVPGNTYEMLYDNINNYNRENDSYIIYVTSYKHSDLSELEDSLKSVIIDSNIKNIICINVDELDKYSFFNRLISDFSDGSFNNINIKNLPVFVFFENGKIVNVVSLKDSSSDYIFDLLEEVYD